MVVSNGTFNQHTGLAIVCPIANTNRRHPFHVSVPQALSLTGFIMVEQVKSVDYHSREIQFVEKAPQEVMMDVLGILDACIYQ